MMTIAVAEFHNVLTRLDERLGSLIRDRIAPPDRLFTSIDCEELRQIVVSIDQMVWSILCEMRLPDHRVSSLPKQELSGLLLGAMKIFSKTKMVCRIARLKISPLPKLKGS